MNEYFKTWLKKANISYAHLNLTQSLWEFPKDKSIGNRLMFTADIMEWPSILSR